MDIDKLMQELTIAEKCALLVGADSWHTYPVQRLGIPAVMMADGPSGLRKQITSAIDADGSEAYHAVCYPPAATIAASFDVDVARQVGVAIGADCRAKDVQTILAPGLNIKRDPRCGRNFEYFAEDPLLAGELGAAFVRGVQAQGVGACVKHFALNSQESWRMSSDSVCDRRAFREIYAPAFERAVASHPAMVMCSYNRVDGVYAAENRELLEGTLRKTFGFDGVIVSDWGAVSDRSRSVTATLDLEMPGHPYAVRKLMKDVHDGNVAESAIDASVERILRYVDRHRDLPVVPVDIEEQHAIARAAAAGGIVLLKNEEAVLPLAKGTRVAVIGALAEHVRIQGGGSSHVTPHRVDTILDMLPKDGSWAYAEGYRLTGDGYDQALLDAAKAVAQGRDKVIVFVGLTDAYESEGYDRKDLALPFGHEELIRQVSSVANDVIVVLTIGAPVTMPWIDSVKAVVDAYLPGEAGAGAIVDVLYGAVNPSGRLPESYPLAVADAPSARRFAEGNAKAFYQESVFVGYRYYQTKDVPVLFPFGHGLSYTTFSYANLTVAPAKMKAPGRVNVAVEVANTGLRLGKEVVQLYVENPDGAVFRPKRELRAFTKVELAPGEMKTVTFTLVARDFAYFDPAADAFVVPPGTYRIRIMHDAATSILDQVVTIANPACPAPDRRLVDAISYHRAHGMIMTDEDFAILIGREVGPSSIRRRRPFQIDDTFADVSRTLLGGLLAAFARKEALKTAAGKEEGMRLMVERSIMEVPLRSAVVMSGGKLSMRLALILVDLMNLRPDRALVRLFRRD